MNKSNLLKKRTIALVIAQSLASTDCLSATINVNNEGDQGIGCTFREAVDTFNQGIDLSNGCEVLGDSLGTNDLVKFEVPLVLLTEGQVYITRDLSINLGGIPISITGNSPERLLNITNSTVTIDSAELSGGFSLGGGGGLLASSSTIILNDSKIFENSADIGGGIYILENSSLEVNDSTVSENIATDEEGGGVFANASTVTVNRSTISGNSAYGGAGVYAIFSSKTGRPSSSAGEAVTV